MTKESLGTDVERRSTLTATPPTEAANQAAGTQHKGQVRDHFEVASKSWASRYAGRATRMSDLDLQLRRENVHRMLNPLLAAASEPVRLLDVGCGTGDVLAGLPMDAVVIFGVDLAPEMVATAADNYPARRFLATDAAHLPFASNSMSLVTCIGALEYMPEPLAVLRELHRVLRPGGNLVISFPNKRSLCRSLTKIEVAIEQTGISLVKRLLGRGVTPAAAWSFTHQHWTVNESRLLLSQAGLEVGEVFLNTYGLWGRIGRWRVSLWLSRKLSAIFRGPSLVSKLFACTVVIRACKQSD